MVRMKGIGGVFFRALDPAAMNEWYSRHLGVPVSEGGCAVLKWRDHEAPDRERYTVWSAFPEDTDYFGRREQSFMVNYIVESLDEALADLRASGVRVAEETETSEFGRFGWCYDLEGNRVELWEPPK